ncbi:hypothetical protein [Thalassotalea euphylliae]|uniref:KfrA N-terminal DNA-binding domain-containing protein n=1 Tax=Thalassotalea euphylliae TaxID=1655234 RepID=A0A3E0TZS7_9GAMM|nr:hypothetical protein [Thalassotalea euphylliae]REL29485.1 hypothetical protein DXX94_01405 [Thalassotalea euphylliae]
MSVAYEDIKRFCDEISKTEQGNVIEALFDHFDAPQQLLVKFFNQWRAEISYLQSELPSLSDNILKQINADIEKSVANAVGEYQQRINHASQLESYLTNKLSKVENLLTDVQSENASLTEIIASLKTEQTERIQQIKEEHQQSMTARISEHTNEIEEITQRHKQSMASFTKDRDDSIAHLKNELRENKEHAKHAQEEALTALEQRLIAKHQEIEQHLNESLDNVTKEFSSYKLQAQDDKQNALNKLEEQLVKQHSSEAQQLRDKLSETTTAFTEFRGLSAQKLAELEQNHQESITQASEASNLQISNLEHHIQTAKNEHSSAIESLNLAHEQALSYEREAVTKQFQSRLTELEALTSDHQTVIDDINQQHASDIAAIKAAHHQTVTELNNRQTDLLSEATKGSDDVIQSLTSELNQYKQQATDSEDKLKKAQQQNDLLSSEIAQRESKTQALNEASLNKDEIIDQLKASVSDAATKINQLTQKLEESTQAHQVDKENFTKQQQTYSQAEAKISNAELQANELRQENAKLASQVEFVKSNNIATVERLTTKSEQALLKVRELENLLHQEQMNGKEAKEERVKLKEQIEFMKYNQTNTFERLTNSATKANNRVKELEAELAGLKS